MRKLILLLSCLISSLFASSAQPNFVLIYVDDLDFDQISPYDHRKFPSYTGAKEVEGNYQTLTANQNGRFLKSGEHSWYKNSKMLTPHIQQLANEGTRFDRFYVTSSTCTPSRYSLLTGKYASKAPSVLRTSQDIEVPLIGWNSYLEANDANLATELKKAGYKTALVGKWHLSDYELEGADFHKGFKGHHDISGLNKKLRPHQLTGAYFPPAADYGDREVQKEIKRIYELMRQRVLRDSGFDIVDRLYYTNYESLPLPKHMKCHNLEWVTEGGLNFIDDNAHQAFFLYLSLTAPHGQYFEDWVTRDWRASPEGMLKEKPQGMPSRSEIISAVQQAGLPLQNSMATWLDASVGSILEKLKEKGIAENTIVLFISDHQSRGKLTAFEAHRVPAIIKWPKKKPSISKALCSNIDVMPTLLKAVGLKMKGNGMDFAPLFDGQTELRKSLLLETGYSRAVIMGDWKYIANRPPNEVKAKMKEDSNSPKRHIGWSGRKINPTSGWGVRFNADKDFPHYFDSDQVYDLSKDIFEQRNLFDKPEYAAKRKELQEELDRLLDK